MKPRLQKSNETRQGYLAAARRYAVAQFRTLRDTPDFRYCHESHAIARALRLTEKRFTDLGTFGVEGNYEMDGNGDTDFQYLNSGDTYEPTIVHYRGRFQVTSWGDILESIG